jgi:hypothetical protein
VLFVLDGFKVKKKFLKLLKNEMVKNYYCVTGFWWDETIVIGSQADQF